MKSSARVAFFPFSANLEGLVHHPYLDVLGLATTGIGNLIGNQSTFMGLAWKMPGGSAATDADKLAEWNRLIVRASFDGYVADPNHLEGKRKNWTHAPPNPLSGGGAFAAVTTLRLTDEGLQTLFDGHLAGDEHYLRQTFTNYDDACADAQLAIHSIAWANGGSFGRNYPKFAKLFVAGDFEGAVDECWICRKFVRTIGLDGKPMLDSRGRAFVHEAPNARPEDTVPDPANPGVHPRNLANVKLLRNAAYVHANCLDRDRLYYPANAAEVAPTEPPPVEVPPPPTSETFPGMGPTILEGEPPKDE